MNIHEAKSWSEVMGVLNVQKKLTSWVMWIFMKWPYGYFEYLWGDVIGILNNEVTLWKYSEADVMGILKFIFKITRLWIFKIPMISLQEYSKYRCHYEYSKYPCHIFKITRLEYSKYPWHHSKNIPKYPWRQLLNIPLTSFCEYSKYQWRHFMNIRNASFEYSKAVAMGNLNIHDVIGLLNTHEVTSWVI